MVNPTAHQGARGLHKRIAIARLDLGRDQELVVSIDERDRIDIRLWTATAGVRMASANGLTLHLDHLSKLIDALQGARKDGQAIA